MAATLLFMLTTAIVYVHGTPIDNGIESEPEIECASTTIAVHFNTKNTFQGHVYVKGRFAEPDCHTQNIGRRSTGIMLDFSTCGVKRERSANPKGVFVSTTIVITFHPRFLTKIDRAFTIQCFYMEADKTVSTSLEVSDITTGFQTQVIRMPVCRYEILDGPTGMCVEPGTCQQTAGAPVRFAIIGQSVYHKWICDTDTSNTFCMQVHTCSVDDGKGDNLQLITDQGCSTDKNLLDNLEYTGDLMVGKESHVFKYTDRPALFFNCQIAILIKEPHSECPKPQCQDAPATLGRRRRRATAQVDMDEVALIDVTSTDIEILDIQPDASNAIPLLHNTGYTDPYSRSARRGGVCLSTVGLASLLTIIAVGFIATITTIVYTVFRAPTEFKA